MTQHPLDRPAWHALTARQANLALGDAVAVRFRPSVNVFGAACDHAPDSLAALAPLVALGDTLGLIEALTDPGPYPDVPGLTVQSARALDQMVLTALDRRAAPVAIVPLGADDVPAMLTLTALTAPGPFFAETYLQGGYIGVKRDGRLLAMAGERMKPPGFTEVSAVCTHPDARGQGLARALMEAVIGRILTRGETAFLHTYPDNPAVRLYASLGFETRRSMTYTLLSRGVTAGTGP